MNYSTHREVTKGSVALAGVPLATATVLPTGLFRPRFIKECLALHRASAATQMNYLL